MGKTPNVHHHPLKEFLEKKVEKISTNFLWSGKRARVAYDNLIHPYENFGIGLWKPALRARALKSSLLLRILKTPSPLSNQRNLLPHPQKFVPTAKTHQSQHHIKMAQISNQRHPPLRRKTNKRRSGCTYNSPLHHPSLQQQNVFLPQRGNPFRQ